MANCDPLYPSKDLLYKTQRQCQHIVDVATSNTVSVTNPDGGRVDKTLAEWERLFSDELGRVTIVNSGDWSTVAGQPIEEADRFKGYAYPDGSDSIYAVRGSVTLPITRPATPDNRFYLASAVNVDKMRSESASQLGLVYQSKWEPNLTIPANSKTNKHCWWQSEIGQFITPVSDVGFTTGATFNADNWVLRMLITRSFFGDKVIFADELNGGFSEALDTAKDGSTIILSNKTYNIVGKHKLGDAPYPAGNWKGNTVKNLRIIGAGMPNTNTDETRFIDGTGTIIQGSLINYVDGFKCFDLGVDVGDYVVDNLAGGEFMDGFIPSTHRMNTSWDDTKSEYNNDIDFANIRVLAKNPTRDQSTWKHAVLLEYADGGNHGYFESIGGFFSFAYKSRNIETSGNVSIRRSPDFSVIFKTDEYSECGNYNGKTIHVGLDRYPFESGSIAFRATDGTRMKGINFDLVARNFKGVAKNGISSAKIEDVFINNIDIDTSSGIGVDVPDNAIRWHIGEHSIVNAIYGVNVPAGALQCHIGNGTVDGAGNGITGYILDGDVSHGNITARRHKSWGVENKGAVVNRALIKGSQNTLGNLSAIKDVTSAFTLVNGWQPTSGNPFKVTHAEGRFYFSGEVAGGTDNQIISSIPFEASPKTETNTVVAYTGSNWVNKICVVSGEVRVIDAANQPGFISLDGIELYPK